VRRHGGGGNDGFAELLDLSFLISSRSATRFSSISCTCLASFFKSSRLALSLTGGVLTFSRSSEISWRSSASVWSCLPSVAFRSWICPVSLSICCCVAVSWPKTGVVASAANKIKNEILFMPE
jgi:hypothetical protein